MIKFMNYCGIFYDNFQTAASPVERGRGGKRGRGRGRPRKQPVLESEPEPEESSTSVEPILGKDGDLSLSEDSSSDSDEVSFQRNSQ